MGQEEVGTDKMRQLVEIAYGCGRNWQSSQTGYIHYCYSQLDEDYHHPIPTYENLLCVLALMRSRSVESITEAKELLGKLLYFQNDQEGISKGNFPIYLHEYPHCRDRQHAVLLLAPLYWIHKNFHHVIGSELKKRLENALTNALTFCLKTHNERPMAYPQAMKIAACAKATGHQLKDKALEDAGNALLLSYEKLNQPESISIPPAWATPTGLADLLIAFQMIYPEISKSPLTTFWKHLNNTWHKTSKAYCGPGWHEYQRDIDPQQTLYDYFLGYFSGRCSYRSFLNHPVLLQAALVHPSNDELYEIEYPLKISGEIEGVHWQAQQNDDYAISLLEKPKGSSHIAEKALHCLKLLWGGNCNVHSMVFQPTEADSVSIERNESTIAFYITLKPIVPNEKNQEVSFFVDRADPLKIKVLRNPSTTFRMGEKIELSDDTLNMALSFHLHEGDGEFFGHIMPGNRPSQMDLKGARRFNAYDWQLFIRSIRRDENCVIKVLLEIIPSQ